MPKFRLSEPSKSDIASILRHSERQFGVEARKRYRALLTTTFRAAALDPFGPLIQNRGAIRPALLSVHTKHFKLHTQLKPVQRPVHLVFFRTVSFQFIEIVRVVHERMDLANMDLTDIQIDLFN